MCLRGREWLAGRYSGKAIVSHPLSWHRAFIALVLSVQSFIWCRNIIAAGERSVAVIVWGCLVERCVTDTVRF